MPSCFVIQPFDGGPFDKRYEDVLAPAIKASGLEPYRVDRDPGVTIPIEQIEAGIKAADVCLAEITTDNPNVWYELGYAFASQREVVLICAAEPRPKFPFDVQHRRIITYRTDAPSDFETLKQQITDRLKAILSNEERLAVVSSPQLADVAGLSSHEMAGLVSIAQNLDSPSDSVSAYTVRQDMERAGFTNIATTMALKSLMNKNLVSFDNAHDDDGTPYVVYSVTGAGFDWLNDHQDLLALRQPVRLTEARPDTDIPF